MPSKTSLNDTPCPLDVHELSGPVHRRPSDYSVWVLISDPCKQLAMAWLEDLLEGLAYLCHVRFALGWEHFARER